MTSRLGKYKNKALDTSELRRRREESGIQIRKAKREEQVCSVTSPITFRPSARIRLVTSSWHNCLFQWFIHGFQMVFVQGNIDKDEILRIAVVLGSLFIEWISKLLESAVK